MTEEEIILTSLLNCRRIDLYTDKRSLTPVQEKQLSEILQKRKSGEPLQYLLGHCEFMDLKFYVDRRVLIPRPETEFLVEAVIERACLLKGKFLHILDVGTGSGNIAVSLAKNIASCRLTAVDISQDALNVAFMNAKLNNVLERIDFCKSDLFCDITNYRKTKFDFIVSNPPYIATGEFDSLPSDVRKEPSIALNGGADGLSFYRRIIPEAGDFLNDNGFLILEIGDGQRQAVESIFGQYKEFHVVDCLKDCAQTERVMIAELVTHGKTCH